MITRPDSARITRLLRPRSVAVVGASDKPGALGASVLANLERCGFAGSIHPINPNRAAIGGRRCLPDVAALPEGVDVAVLAIPREGVLPTVRALAERSVGAAIIFSAGFAEDGPEGQAQQAEIARVAAAGNLLIEGPNCLGMVNHVDGIPLTFVETEIVAPAGRSAVGVVSQSGAMAAVLCTTFQSRDLAISYSISTGNEAASGVEDYVDWLVDEPNTKVIAMIVEQFRQPSCFLAAAERARAANKQIVLLHPGKSNAARESAATHTGALAGDYKLMRLMVERAGVIFAETLEELGDIVEILVRAPAMPRPDLAVLGESGAFKALTLDLAEELGMPLAPLDEVNSPLLRAALPSFVPVSNPLDITAQGLSQPEIYTDVLGALLDDVRIGAVIAGIIQTDPVTCRIKVPAILAALDGRTIDKPLVFAGLDEGASIPAEYVAALRSRGITWFPSNERALRALARLGARTCRKLDRGARGHLPVPGLFACGGVVPEYRAKALLATVGIAFPASRFAASEDEAVAAAREIGYPVVMKAQAAALSHKSDAGGVVLGLAGEGAVRGAWRTMHESVAAYDPEIRLDGVLIEEMGKRGVEMIVGGRNDPDWGPVVLAGFGGVTAEILQDIRLFAPSMTEEQIIKELMELGSAALFAGYRGSPPLDVAALARLIGMIGGVLLAEPELAELDLNPVVLHPRGEGVVALDAVILMGRDAK